MPNMNLLAAYDVGLASLTIHEFLFYIDVRKVTEDVFVVNVLMTVLHFNFVHRETKNQVC